MSILLTEASTINITTDNRDLDLVVRRFDCTFGGGFAESASGTNDAYWCGSVA